MTVGAPSTPLATQADMERRFGRGRVLQLCDNAVTGSIADTAVIEKILEALLEATGIAFAHIGNSWRYDDFVLLVNGAASGGVRDRALVGGICDIAADVLATGRQEFMREDGSTIYAPRRDRAEKIFKAYAGRERTPLNSPPAPRNRTIGTTTNRPTRPLLFQGDAANPNGKGGF